MIITSLLDTDLYTFTVGQAALHQFFDFKVKYKFKCRNAGIVFTKDIVNVIKLEVEHFCNLRMSKDEINYLKQLHYLKPSFIEFLKLYQPNLEHFKINLSPSGELNITIEGPWFSTIYWEVPLLAIVNEAYTRSKYQLTTEQTAKYAENIKRKIDIAKQSGFNFSEYGTRRRFSKDVQDFLVQRLVQDAGSNFTGTSNVQFAKKYGLIPRGTVSHQWYCAGQGSEEVSLASSQKYMLQKWVDEYRGSLGIALSDTLGFKKFLKDFDLFFAKSYDGVRHDSGDPFEWARIMIQTYKDNKIDPKSKTLVFSDGLTFEKSAELQKEFGQQANIVFGIGTNLTNDFEGVEPLQIVIKLIEVNGKPVAKISDSPGKTMCENDMFINYLRSVI